MRPCGAGWWVSSSSRAQRGSTLPLFSPSLLPFASKSCSESRLANMFKVDESTKKGALLPVSSPSPECLFLPTTLNTRPMSLGSCPWAPRILQNKGFPPRPLATSSPCLDRFQRAAVPHLAAYEMLLEELKSSCPGPSVRPNTAECLGTGTGLPAL